MKILTGLSAIVVFLGAVFSGIMLCTIPFWLLWNHVLTAVFPTINQIGIWQALGLLVLSSMIFKSASFSRNKDK